MYKILVRENYLSMIKNSVGSSTFKNFFAEVDGVKKDIAENGNLSCALFVSNILLINKLITEGHANVKSTILDMQKNSWEEISDLREGAVLHWEGVDFGATGVHEHIGFYIGNDQAISNNSKTGEISTHSFDFEGNRKIKNIFWNKILDNLV
jgi:hypothetical protein